MKKAIPVGVMVILVLSSCVTSKEIVEDTAEWNYVENWKDYIVSQLYWCQGQRSAGKTSRNID